MKPMNVFTGVLILGMLSVHARAQVTVDGTVVDPHDNPVPGALVEIVDEADTNHVFSATTDASGSFLITDITSGIHHDADAPINYLLLQNYPNPFNPSTTIQYSIPRRSSVDISVFNLLGRKIRILVAQTLPAGSGAVVWNATDASGRGVAAGVYICRIETANEVLTRKMLLMDGATVANPAQMSVSENQESTSLFFKPSDAVFTIRVTGQFVERMEVEHVAFPVDSTITLDVTYKSSSTVGTAGGRVGSPDGSLSLHIPQGALAQDTQISIDVLEESEYPAELDTLEYIGEVYDLIPDGLDFSEPVNLYLEISSEVMDSLIEDGYLPFIWGLSISSAGELSMVDSSVVMYGPDSSMNYRGQLSHFSDLTITNVIRVKNVHGEHVLGYFDLRVKMGPDVSGINMPIKPSVKINNNTSESFELTFYNDGFYAVEWQEHECSLFITPHSNLAYNYELPWICREVGDGLVKLVADLGHERGDYAKMTSEIHGVTCVAPELISPSCGDDNLGYLMPNCLDWFGHEPCTAVDEPMGDGTVKNTFGDIKVILDSEVNTYRWGTFPQEITIQIWEQITGAFPFDLFGLSVGGSGGGFAKPSGILNTDDYLVLFNVMHDTIPLSDPDNYYQFGFVFDRDGDTTNNYQPPPEAPFDFFQDTDYWIDIGYQPGFDWFMQIIDTSDGQVESINSDVRAIITGNTIIVFVPYDELPSDIVGYRMTAYRHPGDFGVGGDWDGDVQPPVDEGLRWLYIGDGGIQ